jgi:hypothetical protein
MSSRGPPTWRPTAAETAGSLNVWPAQGGEPHRLPAAAAHPQWFGWSKGNRLLVLKDGQLTAWDPATCKPGYTVGENLAEPVALAPGRNWVIAAVNDQYLEVRDTATGAVVGRCGGEGDWRYLAITHDGKRLAGMRYKPRGPGVPMNHPFIG